MGKYEIVLPWKSEREKAEAKAARLAAKAEAKAAERAAKAAAAAERRALSVPAPKPRPRVAPVEPTGDPGPGWFKLGNEWIRIGAMMPGRHWGGGRGLGTDRRLVGSVRLSPGKDPAVEEHVTIRPHCLVAFPTTSIGGDFERVGSGCQDLWRGLGEQLQVSQECVWGIDQRALVPSAKPVERAPDPQRSFPVETLFLQDE
jgi:hypothetical protein